VVDDFRPKYGNVAVARESEIGGMSVSSQELVGSVALLVGFNRRLWKWSPRDPAV
jgi:hypothetical protein